MTCSVEFGHGWTRLRVVVLPFPQGWLSERNTRARVKNAKREECVTSLADVYFHARTRISPFPTIREENEMKRDGERGIFGSAAFAL